MNGKLGVVLAAVVATLACTAQKEDAPTPAREPEPVPRQDISLPQSARPVGKPVAQSELTEAEAKEFLAAPAQTAAALEANGRAARQTLPVAAQVPGVWIGWYVNRSIDAFREAIDSNKPFVLVLGQDWCGYCTRLVLNALRCPAVQRFAGDAVFAYSIPPLDKGSAAIGSSLRIDSYPTVTVLEPEARMLLERGRINGYFEASQFGEHFDTILWKTPPRRYEEETAALRFPFVAALHAQGRSGRSQTTASAAAGAVMRGLKHMPPEPICR
jgi:hypothetical protein